MAMQKLFGHFENTLDSKGRVSLPVRLREAAEGVEDGDQIFMLTRGTEKYVAVFPISEWHRMVKKIEEKVKDGRQRRIFNRRIHYYSSPQKLDKQGRINIPDHLIAYAGLGKNVEIIGTGRKIEVWNPEYLTENVAAEGPIFDENSNVLDF